MYQNSNKINHHYITFCKNSEEDIPHLFYDCAIVQQFRKDLEYRMTNNSPSISVTGSLYSLMQNTNVEINTTNDSLFKGTRYGPGLSCFILGYLAEIIKNDSYLEFYRIVGK